MLLDWDFFLPVVCTCVFTFTYDFAHLAPEGESYEIYKKSLSAQNSEFSALIQNLIAFWALVF